MKTRLTDQEFATITLDINEAIDSKFKDNKEFTVCLSDSDVSFDEETGFDVFVLRVLVTKKN